ncbi:ATP-binding protein [Streptomyces syringium]|uniref:ATP-binding protein n=1 Tax=Streptomyces syringium TaxID=76729 RepID=UPI0033FBC7DB
MLGAADGGSTLNQVAGDQYNIHMPPPVPSVAVTLRRDTPAFCGREPELQRLFDAALRAAQADQVVAVHAVDGMPGVGKTALATHAGHRLAGHFPDGQLFLDLHGHTEGQLPVEPADALASLLGTIGVAPHFLPTAIEDRSALWRGLLSDKRLLLILDNAVGRAQVEPLLPGAVGCLVIVTSRRRLTALQGVPIPLAHLSPAEAKQMFVRLAPQAAADSAGVLELVGMVGHLPLAIAMLAGLFNGHPTWQTRDLLTRLRAGKNTLKHLRAEDRAMTATFDLSYQSLPVDQQRLLRLLGLHPGEDIDGYAAAALAGVSLGDATEQLEALYNDHLVEEPSYGRYRMHDLVRQYARELVAADPSTEREAALNRLLSYYQSAAALADRYLTRHTRTAPPSLDTNAAVPDINGLSDAADWMQAERSNVVACIQYALAQQQYDRVVGLTDTVASLFRGDGPWNQALTLHTTALGAARATGDRLAEIAVLLDLGVLQWFTGDLAKARASLEQGLTLSRAIGHQLGEANCLAELGAVLQSDAEYEESCAALEEALQIFEGLDDRLGQANALTHLSASFWLMGRHQTAPALLDRALALYRELGQRIGEAVALSDLGAQREGLGDPEGALEALTEALEISRGLHHRRGEANALTRLGSVRHTLGDTPGAMAALETALAIFRELGHRLGQAKALNRMGTVLLDSGRPTEARSSHERALALSHAADSALEEAHSLQGLGRASLALEEPDGHTELRHALTIYHRLGAGEGDQLSAYLADLGEQRAPGEG